MLSNIKMNMPAQILVTTVTKEIPNNQLPSLNAFTTTMIESGIMALGLKEINIALRGDNCMLLAHRP